MKTFFNKIINFKIFNKNKLEYPIIHFSHTTQCKNCRYYSENTGVCTIFNRQSVEARKNEIWCGKDAEFYREKKEREKNKTI